MTQKPHTNTPIKTCAENHCNAILVQTMDRMAHDLKTIWTPTVKWNNHKRENMERERFQVILRALKHNARNSFELMTQLKIARSDLYGRLKILLDNREIHCTEGRGKYYACLGVELPIRDDPAKKVRDDILAYLSEKKRVREINHNLKAYHKRTIWSQLCRLRKNGFVILDDGYYSRIGANNEKL